MMTATEIISQLAKERRVETMVCNISHKDLDADLEDLSQMVYCVLLEYDEDKIRELWERDEMNFFVARIIINQFKSCNSPFHVTIRKFREMAVGLEGKDWTNE